MINIKSFSVNSITHITFTHVSGGKMAGIAAELIEAVKLTVFFVNICLCLDWWHFCWEGASLPTILFIPVGNGLPAVGPSSWGGLNQEFLDYRDDHDCEIKEIH